MISITVKHAPFTHKSKIKGVGVGLEGVSGSSSSGNTFSGYGVLTREEVK